MRTHRLKTLAPYWQRVAYGEKKFEIRKNDRDFQVGDVLELEYVENEGRPIDSTAAPLLCYARVKYVFCGGQYGLEVGYCIMSIELESKENL
jgi:hypothetical protein